MLNKLLTTIRRYDMLKPGDRVTCAVSGGADSVALLFALYLLQDKLKIRVSAAHFNHRLRGSESDRDEEFVRQFCHRYDIPLTVGSGTVVAGKKGLEAAAREARYRFFETLNGKIATAHTADDNAETVLMHLIRGTGLKGLGGIAPVRGNVIRPMLQTTRAQVLAFLQEYNLSFVEDSSNDADLFLRNRLRHHVMPLLRQENPRLAENMSAMAMRLREDEQSLRREIEPAEVLDVQRLRQYTDSRRSREIGMFLETCGVREPEAEHIALAEALVNSEKPSAKASFPGGVTICREYDRLIKGTPETELPAIPLKCPGEMIIEPLGIRVICRKAERIVNTQDTFTVIPKGQIVLRSRCEGDSIKLPGGTKSLKKLYIDRKIPAARRALVPVVADDTGVLGIYGIGANLCKTAAELPAVQICFEKIAPKK